MLSDTASPPSAISVSDILELTQSLNQLINDLNSLCQIQDDGYNLVETFSQYIQSFDSFKSQIENNQNIEEQCSIAKSYQSQILECSQKFDAIKEDLFATFTAPICYVINDENSNVFDSILEVDLSISKPKPWAKINKKFEKNKNEFDPSQLAKISESIQLGNVLFSINDHFAKISSLYEKILNHASNDDISLQVQSQSNRIKELEQKNQELQAKIAQYEKMENIYANSQKELASLKKQNEEYQYKISTLEDDLQRRKQKKTNLNDKFDLLKYENEQITKQLNATIEENKQLRIRAVESSERIAQLENELKDSKIRCRDVLKTIKKELQLPYS